MLLTTVNVRVSASSDDAEEDTAGGMYLTSSDLELVDDIEFAGNDQVVGMRFAGLDIPQGATILNAYLRFQVDEVNTGTTNLEIRGEDVDDAPTFSSATNNISLRSTTDAFQSWTPPEWTSVGAAGTDQQTPDLSAIVQEIVGRPGWQAGNDMAFIIDGLGQRTAESFDGSATGAPLLHVEFDQSESSTMQFAAFGDYGGESTGKQAVANLVDSLNPDFILTVGDNRQDLTPVDINVGKYYSDYIGNYNGAFGPGSPINRFFPSLGNHDWSDGGGIDAYLDYFTLPGNERYYDFVQGPVHFFVLDSDSHEPDGRAFNSIQGQWLQSALTASTAPWKVVYMHHPPYSSSSAHGSEAIMQWPFEDWGATAVLAGHDHTFERIVRDDNADGVDIPYFVTGTGGWSFYSFPDSGFVEGSQERYNADYGAMIVEADVASITFKFYSVAGGGTLIDTFVIGGTIAVDDDETTTTNQAVDIDVLANDNDPVGNTLSITDFTDGANGRVANSGNGILTYTPNPDFNGTDSFSYTVLGGDGQVDTGLVSLTVNPLTGNPTTVDVRVSASSDDAEENASGGMYLTSSDLELVDDSEFAGDDQVVGMRFAGLDIPRGATILNAYLRFQVDEVSTGTADLMIRGEDVDDASTFSSATTNISLRSTTDAVQNWTPPEWTSVGAAGMDQQTPDLSAIVQEIVGRPGWQAGNDMAFIIDGLGRRTAESFDGSATGAPLLHVEFDDDIPEWGVSLLV